MMLSVIMISRLFSDVKYFFGGKKGIADILNSNSCREDEKKPSKIQRTATQVHFIEGVWGGGGGGAMHKGYKLSSPKLSPPCVLLK